jgi:hypothetical protein
VSLGYTLTLVMLAATDWDALTAVSTLVIAAGTAALVIGVVVALVTLGDARKTRHGSLLTDLSRRWDEPVIVESQRLFAALTTRGIIELVNKLYESGKATDEDRAQFTALEAVPNFWELLGVLHRDGAIDTRVIDRMWGDAIRNAWRDWQSPVNRLRELTELPATYSNFQKLADDLRKYRTKRWRRS